MSDVPHFKPDYFETNHRALIYQQIHFKIPNIAADSAFRFAHEKGQQYGYEKAYEELKEKWDALGETVALWHRNQMRQTEQIVAAQAEFAAFREKYDSLAAHCADLTDVVDRLHVAVDDKLRSVMAGNLSCLVDMYRREISSVFEKVIASNKWGERKKDENAV